MTTITTDPASELPGEPTPVEPTATTRRRVPLSVRLPVMILAFAGILSVARVYTDVGQLTSTGMFRAALLLSIPVALAGLGGLWSERSGVINIGLEGMMILGTWFGAFGALQWGPWQGVFCGVAAGAAGGLLHALATVTFGVDQIVSGVAINLLGLGATNFLTTVTWEGATKESPQFDASIGVAHLPWFINDPLFWALHGLGIHFGDWLVSVSNKDWFLLSDLANIGQGVLLDMSWLVFIALLAFPASWYVLWRTPLGLRIRSVGEDPDAAESLGVKVYATKYLAVTVGGALAGFGGVTLVYLFSNRFSSGATNGRGYIGLAAMIFGNWRPAGLFLGAGLFGFMDAMQSQVDRTAHALLVVVAIVLAALAIYLAWKRRFGAAAIVVVIAGLSWWWYQRTDELPREFIPYFPHIATLLVLVFASQHLRMPAANGKVYRRSGR